MALLKIEPPRLEGGNLRAQILGLVSYLQNLHGQLEFILSHLSGTNFGGAGPTFEVRAGDGKTAIGTVGAVDAGVGIQNGDNKVAATKECVLLRGDVRVHGTLQTSADGGETYRDPVGEIDAQTAALAVRSGELEGGSVRYAKSGHLATVEISYPAEGAITPTAGDWNDLATLPEGFRPARDLDFAGVNNQALSDVTRAFRITSGGVIRYWADADGETATVRPAGTIIYIIE